MAAAVADRKIPLPPAPRMPASLRAAAASLARACRGLALAAAGAVMRLLLVKVVGDAVMCLCLASAWILAAGTAAIHLGRAACGNDYAVVLAGAKVGALSAFSFAVLWSPSLLVFINRVAAAGSDASDAEMALAAGAQEVLYYPVFAMFATAPFLLLMLVGGLLNWEMMISVGSLGSDAIWFFIIIPTAALSAWRVTRPGWRYEIDGGDMKLSEDLPLWRTWRMARPAL